MNYGSGCCAPSHGVNQERPLPPSAPSPAMRRKGKMDVVAVRSPSRHCRLESFPCEAGEDGVARLGHAAHTIAITAPTKSPARGGALAKRWQTRSALGDADRTTVAFALDAELHGAVDQREQGVIAAETDAGARMELGAALTHDDVAGIDGLAAIDLHAEVFWIGIAAVSSTAASFLVCHDLLLG